MRNLYQVSNSNLGSRENQSIIISGDPPEFFFDKNPENFASVLEMYRSGKFHIPDGGRGKNNYKI